MTATRHIFNCIIDSLRICFVLRLTDCNTAKQQHVSLSDYGDLICMWVYVGTNDSTQWAAVEATRSEAGDRLALRHAVP